jgi:acetolactate synthase-1/2/3 large subunit
MHGTVPACYASDQADLIIGVGNRFDDRATGKYSAFASRAKVVHIDIDPADIGKNVPVDVPIVADCKPALQSLIREVGVCADHSQWLTQIDQWREQFPLPQAPADGTLSHRHVISEIWRATAGKSLIVTDVGQHQMFMAQEYPFLATNAHFSSGGLGTMGFALPAAIGAHYARPDEPIWCCAGDGGFQMTSQELALVRKHNLPMKIALFNNQYLGMVRQWQELFYNENYVEVDLSGPPDYVKLADAYGIPAWRVDRPDQVQAAIQRANDEPGPVLLEFSINPKENIFPMVVPGTSLGDVVAYETVRNGKSA